MRPGRSVVYLSCWSEEGEHYPPRRFAGRGGKVRTGRQRIMVHPDVKHHILLRVFSCQRTFSDYPVETRSLTARLMISKSMPGDWRRSSYSALSLCRASASVTQ